MRPSHKQEDDAAEDLRTTEERYAAEDAADYRAVEEVLALANERLRTAPNIELIEMKKILEETLEEFPEIGETEDPEMRELKLAEVKGTLEAARTILDVTQALDPVRAGRAEKNVIIPEGWDDPEKPLQ